VAPIAAAKPEKRSLLRWEGPLKAFEIWLEYVNWEVEATIKDFGASVAILNGLY